MTESNNNAAAVCSAQTVKAPLCEARRGSAQSRNGPSEEANAEPVDGARDTTVGA